MRDPRFAQSVIVIVRDDWDTVLTYLAIVFDTPPGELWDRARLLRGLDL